MDGGLWEAGFSTLKWGVTVKQGEKARRILKVSAGDISMNWSLT